MISSAAVPPPVATGCTGLETTARTRNPLRCAWVLLEEELPQEIIATTLLKTRKQREVVLNPGMVKDIDG
jgi:hypothetical protein